MNAKALQLVVLVAALLTACANPRTAGEYRKMHQDHPNAPGARHEKFEVNRPMKQVAQDVKRNAEECLNVTMSYAERTSTSFASGVNRIRPYANITNTSAEIYATSTAVFNGQESDAPHFFYFLLDLTPIAKGKTHAELYYSWGEPIPRTAKAVKAWATGQDVGCPNLAAN